MKATEEEEDYDPLLLENGNLEKKDREGLGNPTAPSLNHQALHLPKHNIAFHEQIPTEENENYSVTSQQKVSFSYMDVVILALSVLLECKYICF